MRRAIKQKMQEHSSTTWISSIEAHRKLKAGGMKMCLPTLLKLLRRGEITGKQLGKKWFVSNESIENLLK
jgi:hypothetical protein